MLSKEQKLRKEAEKLIWNSVGLEFWAIADYILGVERISDEMEHELQIMPVKEIKKFIDFGKKIRKKEKGGFFYSIFGFDK